MRMPILLIPGSSRGKTHHRVARPGTVAYYPHDILKSPKLVSLAARMKLLPAYTLAIIEESGVDNSKMAVSYARGKEDRYCSEGTLEYKTHGYFDREECE